MGIINIIAMKSSHIKRVAIHEASYNNAVLVPLLQQMMIMFW